MSALRPRILELGLSAEPSMPYLPGDDRPGTIGGATAPHSTTHTPLAPPRGRLTEVRVAAAASVGWRSPLGPECWWHGLVASADDLSDTISVTPGNGTYGTLRMAARHAEKAGLPSRT
jgi:hypothetical protein